jgi:EAL domain-containing protein (putative c-di-GMP-specific phosphodiesterase class I)
MGSNGPFTECSAIATLGGVRHVSSSEGSGVVPTVAATTSDPGLPTLVRTLCAVATAVTIAGIASLVSEVSIESLVLAVGCGIGATVTLDRLDGRRRARDRHPSARHQVTNGATLADDLRHAVAHNQLVLHYQPKADLRTGRITGAEALVRWHHPVVGELPPDNFIPLAEDTGLIAEIGTWVLEEACRQSQVWDELLPADFTVAVNLSPRQFHLQRVDEVVIGVLRSTGLAASRLELELTEGHALHQRDDVTRSLSRLVDLGVRCSIDDFGTGYSGLSHLSQLPVTGLKIDKTFIQQIHTTSDRAPIIRAVIALAVDLNLDVVAEGVETRCQLEFLRSNGCHEAQGFYLGRPVPADEFEILLLLDRSSRLAPRRDELAERPERTQASRALRRWARSPMRM